MPLSQAISDTDCIMRDYNQLTAAGSYGERMILNRNQYKLNLTLSPTEQSSELETREGSRDRSGAFRVGQRVLGKPPQQPGDLPDVPLPSDRRLELPSPSLPSLCLPYLPFLSCLLLPLSYQVNGAGFSQASFIRQCREQSCGPILTLPAPASSAASGDHSEVANVLWW